MKNYWKHCLAFGLSLIIFSTSGLFAQDDFDEENECVRKLNKAQKAYDDGLIEEVEKMIGQCLSGNELTKDEKLRGYKLLAMAKTYDGKEKEAEQAMHSFLQLDPEYEPQPGVDPKEFLELYNSYHTSPLYTIGLYGGPNWSIPQSYKEFGAYDTENDTKTYKSGVGFQIGVRGTRYIYKGLNVHLDLVFSQNNFSYSHDILESYTKVDYADQITKSSTKGVTIESIESQTAVNIPISFSYTFLKDKSFRPYVMLGFETRLLIGANNSVTKTYFDQDIASVEIANIENFKDERNSLIFSGLAGIGTHYKVPRGAFFAELKYNIGISDQVNRDAVDVNDDSRLWNFYELDNDFTMDNIYFNIGFNYFFYKPRKMKGSVNSKAIEESMLKEEKKSKKTNDSDSNSSKQRQIIE